MKIYTTWVKCALMATRLIWAWVILAALGGVALASERRPPSATELATAYRQVDELSKRGDMDARQLLHLARQTSSSRPLSYAAIRRSIDLSANNGEAAYALEALDYLHEQFDVDLLRMRLELIERLAKSRHPQSATILAMRYRDAAYIADRMDIADKMTSIIQQTLNSLPRALRPLAHEHIQDHEFARQLNRRDGVFASLYQGQWQDNLSVLAAGDTEFKQLAAVDMNASDRADRLRAADGWWMLAQEQSGLKIRRIAQRAVEIYQKEISRSDGVERELLSGRIAEHQRRTLLAEGYHNGLIRQSWRHGQEKRQTETIADLRVEREDTTLNLGRSGGGNVKIQGYLLIQTPGRHELTFIGGTSMTVTLDNEKVIDNPSAFQKRSGERVSQNLSSGLVPIEIILASNSSQPRLMVEWTTPTQRNRKAIPQDFLFYDSLLIR